LSSFLLFRSRSEIIVKSSLSFFLFFWNITSGDHFPVIIPPFQTGEDLNNSSLLSFLLFCSRIEIIINYSLSLILFLSQAKDLINSSLPSFLPVPGNR
jgi:hypothetical protein